MGRQATGAKRGAPRQELTAGQVEALDVELRNAVVLAHTQVAVDRWSALAPRLKALTADLRKLALDPDHPALCGIHANCAALAAAPFPPALLGLVKETEIVVAVGTVLQELAQGLRTMDPEQIRDRAIILEQHVDFVCEFVVAGWARLRSRHRQRGATGPAHNLPLHAMAAWIKRSGVNRLAAAREIVNKGLDSIFMDLTTWSAARIGKPGAVEDAVRLILPPHQAVQEQRAVDLAERLRKASRVSDGK